jgi:hypothetical protein
MSGSELFQLIEMQIENRVAEIKRIFVSKTKPKLEGKCLSLNGIISYTDVNFKQGTISKPVTINNANLPTPLENTLFTYADKLYLLNPSPQYTFKYSNNNLLICSDWARIVDSAQELSSTSYSYLDTANKQNKTIIDSVLIEENEKNSAIELFKKIKEISSKETDVQSSLTDLEKLIEASTTQQGYYSAIIQQLNSEIDEINNSGDDRPSDVLSNQKELAEKNMTELLHHIAVLNELREIKLNAELVSKKIDGVKIAISTEDIKELKSVSAKKNSVLDEKGLVEKIDTKLTEYKDKIKNLNLSSVNIDLTSGDIIDKSNKLIFLFNDAVNNILSDPVLFKLTSLDNKVFKKLILSCPFKRNVNTSFSPDEIINEIYKPLVEFLYFDCSVFIKLNSNIGQIFFKDSKFLTQDTNITKYSKNRDIYLSLVDPTNNNFNPNEFIVLYISSFKNLMNGVANEFSKNKKNTYRYDLYCIITSFLFDKINSLITLKTTVLEYFKSVDNEVVFMQKLEFYIFEKTSNNVITYLKLRNDDDAAKEYNERFLIKINKPFETDTDKTLNKISIKYINDNIPFYRKDDKHKNTRNFNFISSEILRLNELSVIDKYSKLQQKSSGAGLSTLNIDEDKYDYNYIFGEFSKIFLPHIKNPSISNEMTVIKEKICGLIGTNGKYVKNPVPVFMIGYGASGAGKTSSLVYFNKGQTTDERNGILVHLCNQLGADGKYNIVKLKSKEFYHVNDDDYKKEDGTRKPFGDELDNTKGGVSIVEVGGDEGIEFYYNEEKNDFVLSEIYNHPNHHFYRSLKLDKKSKEKIGKEFEPFEKDTPLGEVAVHLIDTDRFVKATTNNPNSSRSHTIIIVQLFKKLEDNKIDHNTLPATLIIGDFAGVENAFACEEPTTINKFLNVERDDGSKRPYYSTESYKGDPDPFGPIKNELNQELKEGGAVSNECKPKIDITDKIFNFENPEIRESFKLKSDTLTKFDSIVNINGNNISLFKFLINIVRNFSNPNKITNENEIEKNYAQQKNKLEKCLNNLKILLEMDNDKASKLITETLQENKYVVDSIDEKNLLNAQKSTVKEDVENLKKIKGLVEKYQKMSTITSYNSFKATKDKATLKEAFITRSNVYKLETEKDKELITSYFGKASADELFIKKTYTSSDNGKFLADAEVLEGNVDALKKFSNILKDKINNTSVERVTKKIADFDKNDKTILKLKNLKTATDFDDVDNFIFIKNSNDLVESNITTHQFVNLILKKLELVELDGQSNISGENKQFLSALNIENFNFDNLKNLNEFIQKLNEQNINLKSIDESLNTLFKDKSIYVSNGKAIDFYDMVKEMEIEYSCRLGNSNVICENRREEGYFINDSLFKIREVIKKMLYEKNKDAINVAPNYIDICFDNYCPKHENCFAFDSIPIKSQNNEKTGSVIFDAIFKELKKTSPKEYTAVENMYQKLIMGVFCVFNISRAANNPPPTPYLDINELKSLFYYYYKDIFSETPVQEKHTAFIQEAEKIINMIGVDNSNIDGGAPRARNQVEAARLAKLAKEKKEKEAAEQPAKLEQEKIAAEQAEILEQEKIAAKLAKAREDEENEKIKAEQLAQAEQLAAKNKEKEDKTFIDSISNFNDKVGNLKIIKDKDGNSIFNLFYNIYNEAKNNNKFKDNVVRKENIKNFIEMIDKSNAVSAIGTLEFLDQLSKFNAVKTICSRGAFLDTDKISKFESNDGKNMIKLYQHTADENQSGGANRHSSTKYNKLNKLRVTKKHRKYLRI